jgi:hypothetical protein
MKDLILFKAHWICHGKYAGEPECYSTHNGGCDFPISGKRKRLEMNCLKIRRRLGIFSCKVDEDQDGASAEIHDSALFRITRFHYLHAIFL